jgi:DNA transformation protein
MAGGFKEFLEELFEPLGGTTIRRMFGGHGVFRDGLMFAILSDDLLYFRVDAITQPRFEAERSEPFMYEGKGRSVRLPYWRVPDWLFDEADAFLEWAQQSFAAARRVNEAKAPKRGRTAESKPAKKAKSAAKQAAPKKKPARAAKAAKAAKPVRSKPARPKKSQKIRKKSAARA